MSIVNTKRADMCYCPGCSHGTILEALGKAIDRLGRPQHEVCLVSDIGCIGTADRYFSCHTFHGLHGRSIAYAEGIRRARPELLVVVLIGDGGCGIGTAHLVHAARRRADIKILVCNNFNFGMTGGQHSPTTPCDARTTTTPSGAADVPFDVCATVAANGASFVARQDVFDPGLVDSLEQTLLAPGFALIDIWELCTAYFVPANRFNRGSLLDLSNRTGMPFGVIQDRRESGGSNGPASPVAAPSRRPRIAREDTTPALAWPGRRELCVAGSAGQRIRSAVGVIGDIAVASKLFAVQQDDFPITVRKGFSVSSLIVAGEPIRYTGVDEPDVVVLLSPDGVERFGDLSTLREPSWVFVEKDLPIGTTDAKVVRIDPATWDKTLSREATSLAAMAFALVATGLLSPASLTLAADSVLTGSYRDENLRAIRAGCERAAPTCREAIGALPRGGVA